MYLDIPQVALVLELAWCVLFLYLARDVRKVSEVRFCWRQAIEECICGIEAGDSDLNTNTKELCGGRRLHVLGLRANPNACVPREPCR